MNFLDNNLPIMEIQKMAIDINNLELLKNTMLESKIINYNLLFYSSEKGNLEIFEWLYLTKYPECNLSVIHSNLMNYYLINYLDEDKQKSFFNMIHWIEKQEKWNENKIFLWMTSEYSSKNILRSMSTDVVQICFSYL